jgi:chromosome segregation ATPase
MPKEKRKINAWLPVSLYNKLETAGYENVTQALIKAIEGNSQDTKGSNEDIERIQEGYKQDIEKLNQDITGYKTDIEGYLQDITGYKRDIAALTIENDNLKEDLSGYHRIHEGSKKDIEKLNQDISGYKQDIKVLNNEIEKLEKNLAKAPDREELIKLQVTNEGLKSLLEEREKRIEEINSHYENIKSFANYFKSSEPKQIEAPSAEKTKPWYKIW